MSRIFHELVLPVIFFYKRNVDWVTQICTTIETVTLVINVGPPFKKYIYFYHTLWQKRKLPFSIINCSYLDSNITIDQLVYWCRDVKYHIKPYYWFTKCTSSVYLALAWTLLRERIAVDIDVAFDDITELIRSGTSKDRQYNELMKNYN